MEKISKRGRRGRPQVVTNLSGNSSWEMFPYESLCQVPTSTHSPVLGIYLSLLCGIYAFKKREFLQANPAFLLISFFFFFQLRILLGDIGVLMTKYFRYWFISCFMLVLWIWKAVEPTSHLISSILVSS